MKLLLLQFAGMPDRRLLGRIDADQERALRGEPPPGPPGGTEDEEPDEAPILLRDPAELYTLVAFGEGAVASSQAAGVGHYVQRLPTPWLEVYLDGVVAMAVLPLESEDGAEPAPVVTMYRQVCEPASELVARKEGRRRMS